MLEYIVLQKVSQIDGVEIIFDIMKRASDALY
jgi:hypothetical protein